MCLLLPSLRHPIPQTSLLQTLILEHLLLLRSPQALTPPLLSRLCSASRYRQFGEWLPSSARAISRVQSVRLEAEP